MKKQFESSGNAQIARRVLISCGLAFGLATVVVTFGANYQHSRDVMEKSLGGDFLQDWIGGYVVNSPAPERLYASDHTNALQHDAQLVGFRYEPTAYFPMVYPPAWYVIVSPLAMLPYHVACRAWVFLMALFLPVCIWGACKWRPTVDKFESLFIPGIFLFPPVVQSVVMGQKSLLWLAVILVMITAIRKGYEKAGGAVFGLLLFKPTFVPVILILMAFHKRWSFVFASAVSAGSIFLLSLFWLPLSTWFDYLEVVRGVGKYHETAGYSAALAQNLGAILKPISLDSTKAYWILYLAAAGGVCWLMLRASMTWHKKRYAEELYVHSEEFWISAVSGTILLSPHFYFYDLTILFVAAVALRSSPKFRVQSLAWIGLVFMACVFNEQVVATFSVPLVPIVLIALMIRISGVAEGFRFDSRVFSQGLRKQES